MGEAGDPAVIGVVGWKDAGKTTMVTRLVAALVADGLRVSTVKHAHVRFEIDHEGKDSHRHRTAGATQVAVVSPLRWALMHELRGAAAPSLAEVLGRLDPCDVVVVEGYKSAPHPKLEVRRHGARSRAPIGGHPGAADPTVVAIASDGPVDGATVPVFHNDDIAAILDHLRAQGLVPGAR